MTTYAIVPIRSPSPTAERTRSYRQRLRRGLRCVRITIGSAELNGLVEKGYLAPSDRENVEAIECAVYAFISDALCNA